MSCDSILVVKGRAVDSMSRGSHWGFTGHLGIKVQGG